MLIGLKECPHCGVKGSIRDRVILSFSSKLVPCDNCRKNYGYSKLRRWVALILLLIIIFLPTIATISNFFKDDDNLIEKYFYLKYFVAMFVVYIVAGNSHTDGDSE